MIANDLGGGFAPCADELARIERVKSELRESARWVVITGLALPSVLVAGGLVLLIAYPGQVPIGLGALLAMAPAVVSFLLIVYGDSGRPLRLYRALGRDAARGYLVEKRRGEITWAAHPGTFVATAGGLRLVSPWFTECRPVPTQWHHFEKLAPGHYEFEVLPESGLVLAAQALSGASTADRGGGSQVGLPPQMHAGNLAIQSSLHLHPSDLLLNRSGRASGRQRRRLVWQNLWLFLSVALCAPTGLLAAVHTIKHPDFWVGFTALGLSAIAVGCAWAAKKIVIDALLGEVDTAVGFVQFRNYGEMDAEGVILQNPVIVEIDRADTRRRGRRPSLPLGSVTFCIRLERMRVFQPSVRHRVFLFRNSRALAAAEVVEP
ncbi:MAG: hypothetical protein ABSB49_02950 [Polyangia bacterium]|jgi:hypothetical protein